MSKPFKLPAFFDSKVKKTEMKEEEKTRQRIRVKEHVHGNWPTLIFIPSNTSEKRNFTSLAFCSYFLCPRGFYDTAKL